MAEFEIYHHYHNGEITHTFHRNLKTREAVLMCERMPPKMYGNTDFIGHPYPKVELFPIPIYSTCEEYKAAIRKCCNTMYITGDFDRNSIEEYKKLHDTLYHIWRADNRAYCMRTFI